MRAVGVPSVPNVLSESQVRQTARSIAAAQESSGALPWFPGGHTDPWDHVESAMALAAAGLIDEAEAAYGWSRQMQRPDGSWPMKFRDGVVENHDSDSNFCAYLAVGVWHHYLITGDRNFVEALWPSVQGGLDFVVDMQAPSGEIWWARGENGQDCPEALLTGNSSIHHSLHCGLLLARLIDDPQPEWEFAKYTLGHAIRQHPESFAIKDEYSMDWYYPILGGAVRGAAASERIDSRWDDFVVEGLGIRCVDHRPWVTGAETCELVLALDAMGERARALAQFTAMQHLRDPDGSYWTGLVYSDGKRWPVEQTTWTGGAMILAADALSRTTPGHGIFRDAALPVGLPIGLDRCGDYCQASGSPV
ncbi:MULTISPECIES: prenyltransferase [unclassified Rhodococcus (in: high G+C Gram-positive bacteria)]|uniref:prenyltransferase n=1 Tax=unclassified Rhodococcus (in: high G+C Gram-positive bacteria) TaxID=192944 RepID=UPI00163B00C0|nr:MULTISPECIES: prenyltransferase [unclassified Rhodococcus (in: high G+C Gram-positive bacteria)]MBC2642237.1 prenyltransferase [Rhodococcus sp. 3A]MBC2893020.1 prenyltransferase [Rhodococcus sp. 4CII]